MNKETSESVKIASDPKDLAELKDGEGLFYKLQRLTEKFNRDVAQHALKHDVRATATVVFNLEKLGE